MKFFKTIYLKHLIILVIILASATISNSILLPPIKDLCADIKSNMSCLSYFDYSESDKEIKINFYLKGEYSFKPTLIDNPSRIVLDLWQVINKLPAEKLIDGIYLKSIRSSQFKPSPDFLTRIVIDLQNTQPSEIEYFLNKEKEKLSLKIKINNKEVNKTTNNFDEKSTLDTTNKNNIESSNKLLEQIKELEKAAVPESDYIIGPEDLLEIRVFELPELNNTVRVSADGKINIPPIGDINVDGLPKSEVEKKIQLLLQNNFVNNAHVVIFIKEYRSQKVNIIGAVKKPGNYPILAKKTLLELLSEAGGISDNAGEKLFVFRKNNPETIKLEINIKELLSEGNVDLNIIIKPGDVINIPPVEKITIYVYGEVATPGAIEINKNANATLLKAIIKAGGPTERANLTKVLLKRTEEGKEKTYKINVKDIINGKATDKALQDGDIIIIPESFF